MLDLRRTKLASETAMLSSRTRPTSSDVALLRDTEPPRQCRIALDTGSPLRNRGWKPLSLAAARSIGRRVINPPAMALRRRSEELFASAEREKPHDPDSAALLLFYAVECGLKSVYMLQHNLKYTDEARGSAKSARSFSHNIVALIQALNISRASVRPVPAVVTVRLGLNGTPAVLHEAWRYGEKIQDTNAICDWLKSLLEWCKKNR